MRVSLFAAALCLTLAACSSTQQVYEVTEVDRPPEFERDTLVVEDPAGVTYVLPAAVTPDVAPDRSVDILSTALDLAFGFEDETVQGTARHTLTPLRSGVESFYLHAADMEIENVRQIGERGVGHGYEGDRLTVTPATPLAIDSVYTFEIDYLARPTLAGQGALGDGGSGLYFIDPSGTDPGRPTQLWTQGQAESNRRWFPTWDYPNDRMGFEISMTVPDSLVTAANGALVEQTDLGSGMRRDRYVLEGDQVAYLAAVAAGPFAVVRDSVMSVDSTAIPLAYFVEPEFEEAVPRIFGETPRMMEVFEEKFGVPYPWPDYKQMAVRDFTAGGMENTTITLLFEHIQTDERAYLDYTGRDLIAHELAHQWFGNLVTTKDWANLALNESFASYFEEVYLEEAFGRAEAQAHGIADRDGYFAEAERHRRPIVWYGYSAPDGMFDRHTYQKGGQVLNQLRFELGDDAFWRGMQHYLTKHRYGSVEMADFRIAMEETSGRSLRRFFDQWWHRPGHPVLEVEQAYFAGSSVYTVQVVQRQDLANAPTFAFETNIELNYPNQPREVRRVRIARADTTLRFSVPEAPSFVRFDEGNWTFADILLRQPLAETLVQAVEDDEMAGRYDAVVALAGRDLNLQVREVLLRAATEDAHPLVRERAAGALEPYAGIPEVTETLAQLGQADETPAVRRAALRSLAEADSAALVRPALRAALDDASYLTQAQAVRLYAKRFRDDAFDAVQPLLDAPLSWRGRVEQALVEVITEYRLGGVAGAEYLAAQTDVLRPDPVRLSAIEGLLVLGRRDEDIRMFAAGALAARVGDLRPAVREAVAEALGEIGDAAALEALEAQAEVERDADVQAALRGAIEQRKKGSTQVGSGE
ncbi:MAG: M1 family aminopeptidase [Bacteroidota bacterium]